MKAIIEVMVLAIAMATPFVFFATEKRESSATAASPAEISLPPNDEVSADPAPPFKSEQNRAKVAAAQDTANAEQACVIEEFRAEVARLQERVRELEAELALYRTAAGPFREFLNSWDATLMTVEEKQQIAVFLDYCPVVLAPGEALGLKDVCKRGENCFAAAIRILGPNRILRELTAEQLERLFGAMNEEDQYLLGVKPGEER